MPSAYPRPTKEKLEQLYFEKCMSAADIGKIYKCHRVTVVKWLKDDGVKPRTKQEADAIIRQREATKYIEEQPVIEAEYEVVSEAKPSGTYGLANSSKSDDELIIDSAYLRLSHKQKAYVDIITDLDPTERSKSREEIARELKVDPDTIKAWRRLPDVIEAIDEVAKPENKSRLGELYRKSLIKKFHEGRDTKEDRKLAAEIVGDLRPATFNTAIQVNLKTTDW